MNNDFDDFYLTLDKNKFKYFVSGDTYFVYNGDIDKLSSYNPKDVCVRKSSRKLELGINNLEDQIKHMLLTQRIPVQEYTNKVLTKEGFPGNWGPFSYLLLDKKIEPTICSVLTGPQTQLAFLSSGDSTIWCCEFEDDDLYSHLYALISELNVVELIYESNKMEKFIYGLGLLGHKTSRPKSNKQFALDGNTKTENGKEESEDRSAHISLSSNCVKERGGILLDEESIHKYSAVVGMLTAFLKIDVASFVLKLYLRPNICSVGIDVLEALNIVSDKEYGVIDTFTCYTSQGNRLLHKIFRQPLRNKGEIVNRQRYVDAFRSIDLNLLGKFPDLLKIIRRIQNSRLSLQEVVKLYRVIVLLPDMLRLLGSEPTLSEDFVKPLENLNHNFLPLKEAIAQFVDLEAANEGTYRFRLDLSEKLEELDEARRSVYSECEVEYNRILKVFDKAKFDRKNCLVKITKTDYQSRKNEFKKHGFLERSFLKSSVTFTSLEMSKFSDVLNKLNEETEKEERELRDALKAVLLNYVSLIESLNYLISVVDVFNSFAIKSFTPGYSKPDFGEYLDIQQGFHPLLENKDYISNDIRIDNKKVCVITGPNMGGKSTFLKMCGTVALLAQIGSYVPAQRCIMPIFDGIYARVGANDSAYRGMSTFMVEMMDIAKICKLSTKSSFVLIDELGRGTSAIDGLSIARAVKEYLVEHEVTCLFATHFPELCGETVLNKKVKSDGLTLLYEVVDGVCDTSFGLMVAEKVDFPEEVIKMAKENTDIW